MRQPGVVSVAGVEQRVLVVGVEHVDQHVGRGRKWRLTLQGKKPLAFVTPIQTQKKKKPVTSSKNLSITIQGSVDRMENYLIASSDRHVEAAHRLKVQRPTQQQRPVQTAGKLHIILPVKKTTTTDDPLQRTAHRVVKKTRSTLRNKVRPRRRGGRWKKDRAGRRRGRGCLAGSPNPSAPTATEPKFIHSSIGPFTSKRSSVASSNYQPSQI